MIRLKAILTEAVNPAIKRMYPKYRAVLEKRGYELAGDGTGMAFNVVKGNRVISGPWGWGNQEAAVWVAAKKLGLVSTEDVETVTKYRWR